MPLYFAYGSNMDIDAMAARCPKSQPVGAAMLRDHRIVIMQEGYASIVRQRGAIVYGLLWDVALSDVRALDAYEAVGAGMYRKILQPVKRLQGGAARALVYVGRGAGGGAPLAGYLENVVACARSLGLPEAYVRELGDLSSPGGAPRRVVAGRAPAMRKGLPGPPERDESGRIKVRPRYASPLDRGGGKA